MSVFRNYDPSKSGNVNANAFPRVYSLPWVPTQQNVRSNPGIPSQPQRIQPNERGTFYPTSASSGGTLAPSMSSSGGCGCGGGGSAANATIAPATASQTATQHAFHGSAGKIVPRSGLRGTGMIKSPITRRVNQPKNMFGNLFGPRMRS